VRVAADLCVLGALLLLLRAIKPEELRAMWARVKEVRAEAKAHGASLAGPLAGAVVAESGVR
jgi:hypothetical protein